MLASESKELYYSCVELLGYSGKPADTEIPFFLTSSHHVTQNLTFLIRCGTLTNDCSLIPCNQNVIN